MNQPLLNFDTSLPISGRTLQSRHSSSTGAQRAARDRGPLSLAYRRLLIESGPQSDVEASRLLGRPISSMCSVRNGWGEHVVPSGTYEQTSWGTKRTRWMWTP